MYINVTDYVEFCKQNLYIFNKLPSVLARWADRGLRRRASIEALFRDRSLQTRPI